MDTSKEHHEHLSPSLHLFPLTLEPTVNAVQRLADSSTGMLSLIVTARGKLGPADSLFANIPVDKLVAWHQGRKDAALSATSELYYRSGLLYGLDMAESIAKEIDMDAGFKLDSTSDIGATVERLLESYDEVPQSAEPWRYQKARELRHTGGSVLTIINAGLTEAISDTLSKSPMGSPGQVTEPEDDTQHEKAESYSRATHLGLVDGVILGNAFRSQKLGIPTTLFEEPSGIYIEDYDPQKHRGYPYDYPFRNAGAERIILYNITDLLRIADGMKAMDRLSTMRMLGIEKEVRGRLVQDDVNSFMVVAEEAKMRVRSTPAAFLGAFVTGLSYDYMQRLTGQEFASADFFIPDATIMAMSMYSLLACGKKSIAKSAARIEGIPLERVGLVRSAKEQLSSLRRPSPSSQ